MRYMRVDFPKIPFILCELRHARTNSPILTRHILDELAANQPEELVFYPLVEGMEPITGDNMLKGVFLVVRGPGKDWSADICVHPLDHSKLLITDGNPFD